METKQEMTVKDVLTDINKVLNGINVPMSMLESIGMPIARAIGGINVCINAINEEEQKQNKPEEDDMRIEEVVEDIEDKGEQDA